MMDGASPPARMMTRTASRAATGGTGRQLSRAAAPCAFAALVAGLGLVFRSVPAKAAPLDRFVGSFAASGTVVEGPNASSHQVRCGFTALRQGAAGLALRGTCRAYLVMSRSISADLVLDTRSGRVTGTYTGARVGTARLIGRRRGEALDLVINWPAPVYGDTTANLRIVSLDPNRLRIEVIDRIGASGPIRATTDLLLVRQ
jgi:hypothetical protein